MSNWTWWWWCRYSIHFFISIHTEQYNFILFFKLSKIRNRLDTAKSWFDHSNFWKWNHPTCSQLWIFPASQSAIGCQSLRERAVSLWERGLSVSEREAVSLWERGCQSLRGRAVSLWERGLSVSERERLSVSEREAVSLWERPSPRAEDPSSGRFCSFSTPEPFARRSPLQKKQAKNG